MLEVGYYSETVLLFEIFIAIFIKRVIHVPAIENGILSKK